MTTLAFLYVITLFICHFVIMKHLWITFCVILQCMTHPWILAKQQQRLTCFYHFQSLAITYDSATLCIYCNHINVMSSSFWVIMLSTVNLQFLCCSLWWQTAAGETNAGFCNSAAAALLDTVVRALRYPAMYTSGYLGSATGPLGL